MLKSRWLSTDSTLSKKGSPTPAGRPSTAVSRMPPTLSPSAPAARMADRMDSSRAGSMRASCSGEAALTAAACWAIRAGSSAAKGRSSTPAAAWMWVAMVMPLAARTCWQMAPAATSGAVMRPEKWPPPRLSCQPPYLA